MVMLWPIGYSPIPTDYFRIWTDGQTGGQTNSYRALRALADSDSMRTLIRYCKYANIMRLAKHPSDGRVSA